MPTQSPQRFPLQVEMTGGGNNYNGNNGSEGGFPFLPVLLIAGVAALVFARAKKKGISKKEYILSKFNQAQEAISTSGSNPANIQAVKQAVDEYKLNNPDKADNISYTNSCVTGDFIAIKSLDGKLLAEIPLTQAA